VFLEGLAPPGGVLALPETARRHLGTVLRLGAGAALIGVAPDGTEWDLEWVGDGRARVLAVRATAPAPEPETDVTLAVAVPRGERMDWLIEKAVEIGAAAILPLLAERSAPAGHVGAGRPARWERLARAAAEQSGRRRIPPVLPACGLAQALAGVAGSRLLAHPGPAGAPGGLALAPRPSGVLIAIGPEGGWSEGEVSAALEAGARLLPLGPRILRIETAALVALTLVLSALGSLGRTGPEAGA